MGEQKAATHKNNSSISNREFVLLNSRALYPVQKQVFLSMHHTCLDISHVVKQNFLYSRCCMSVLWQQLWVNTAEASSGLCDDDTTGQSDQLHHACLSVLSKSFTSVEWKEGRTRNTLQFHEIILQAFKEQLIYDLPLVELNSLNELYRHIKHTAQSAISRSM